jgi:hypothetical protein
MLIRARHGATCLYASGIERDCGIERGRSIERDCGIERDRSITSIFDASI